MRSARRRLFSAQDMFLSKIMAVRDAVHRRSHAGKERHDVLSTRSVCSTRYLCTIAAVGAGRSLRSAGYLSTSATAAVCPAEYLSTSATAAVCPAEYLSTSATAAVCPRHRVSAAATGGTHEKPLGIAGAL